MKIVWDEPKRLANLYKHGLDFQKLTLAYFYGSHVIPARGRRLKAVGALDGRTIAVIFTRLGSEAVSVISMRIASPRERRLANDQT